MKRLLVFIALCLTASAAEANTLYLHCLRYQSQCSGQKCLDIGEALKATANSELLKTQAKDVIDFTLEEDHGAGYLAEDAPNAVKIGENKYKITYQHVFITPETITLEHKEESGKVRGRSTIDKLTGIYMSFVLHTDGSLKDVPVGAPYTAFFGWCEDVTDKHP